jgi:hypothetical protein
MAEVICTVLKIWVSAAMWLRNLRAFVNEMMLLGMVPCVFYNSEVVVALLQNLDGSIHVF